MKRSQKRTEITICLWKRSTQYLEYYFSLKPSVFKANNNNCRLHLYLLQMLADVMSAYDEDRSDDFYAEFERYAGIFLDKGGKFN